MQTVVETASKHKASGKFVNDYYFSVFYNIIYIYMHNSVSLQRLINMMQQRHIIWIHKVINIKILFSFFNARTCNCSSFSLFIYNIINIFINFVLILFIINFNYSCGHKILDKFINNIVKLCRLVPFTGNNKRSSCFVNKNRVNLVDNCKVRFSLYSVLGIYHHIITQIIKTQLIVCSICNITVVCSTAFFICQSVKNTADSKS